MNIYDRAWLLARERGCSAWEALCLLRYGNIVSTSRP